MEQLEFKISAMPEHTFRVKKINAEEINAIATAMDLGDIQKNLMVNDYVLRKLEVNIKDTWVQVKKNKNEYLPGSLEDNAIAVKELVEYFLENVVFKAFQKSSE